MNMFKALDSFFPCGAARLSGEVVSLSIVLKGLPVSASQWGGDSTVSWKRKAWYVNASVNAFHMHRGLVGEASKAMDLHGLSSATQRMLKRQIAVAIAISYSANYLKGDQYFGMVLECTGDAPGRLWLDVVDFEDEKEVLALSPLEDSRPLVTEVEGLIRGLCKLEA